MALVRPFKAVRPDKKYVEKVISLPYDVMNRQEAADMAAGNPYSFLHICRSEIDMPEQHDAYDKSVYEMAKSNLGGYLKNGILVREEKPALYIYREIMEGRVQTGIVGCVSVDEYLDNTIKKHEFTRIEKETDRINHFDICSANTEPVFLTYRNDKRIKYAVENWIDSHEPVYDLTLPDGISHMLWVIDDSRTVSDLSNLFDKIPSFYIADGHHRSASACKVGLKRRKENPDYTGDEEFNFFMAVIFPDNDLHVFDYNRVVKDLNGNTADEFIAKIKEAEFEIRKKGKKPYRPGAKHIFGMFLDGIWYELTANDSIIPDDVIGALDVSLLQDNLLGPVLGINDPRKDKRIDFVGGIRGPEGLEKRCNTDMKVAFAVYPVEIADLMDVSDNGLVMPPKSTWFEPKLGSGLFIHEI